MTAHPILSPDPVVDDPADGGTWLLDLVAAVDHLRRGYRPDITVWHALTEAIDWYVDDKEADDRRVATSGDGLGEALARIPQPAETPTAERIQAAMRRWVTTMADRYNEGHHWPHPVARRGFPPPMLDD